MVFARDRDRRRFDGGSGRQVRDFGQRLKLNLGLVVPEIRIGEPNLNGVLIRVARLDADVDEANQGLVGLRYLTQGLAGGNCLPWPREIARVVPIALSNAAGISGLGYWAHWLVAEFGDCP